MGRMILTIFVFASWLVIVGVHRAACLLGLAKKPKGMRYGRDWW